MNFRGFIPRKTGHALVPDTWMTGMPGIKRTLLGVRSRPLLVRLIISYTVAVLSAALGVSIVSLAFFQSRYDRELTNLHGMLVDTLEREIRNRFVETADRVYRDIAARMLTPSPEFLGPEDASSGNSARIYSTYSMLTALVGKTGSDLAAIHIHYKNTNILLSSEAGLKYRIGEPDGPAEYAPGVTRVWSTILADSEGDGEPGFPDAVWNTGELLPRPPGPVDGPRFSMLRPFPPLSKSEFATAIIALEFRSSSLEKELSRDMRNTAGMRFLVDPTGRIIAGKAPEKFRSILERAWKMANGRRSTESFRIRFAGVWMLATVRKVGGTNWDLVDLTPLARLYAPQDSLAPQIALICLAAIVLGLATSYLFGRKIYAPVGQVFGRIAESLGLGMPEHLKDEERFLENAIDGLMDSLATGRSLVGHEIARRLARGSRFGPGELESTCRVFGLSGFYEQSSVFFFVSERINPLKTEDAAGKPTRMDATRARLDDRSGVYRAVELLQAEGGSSRMTTILGENRLYAIMGQEKDTSGPARKKLADTLAGALASSTGIQFRISIVRVAGGCEAVHAALTLAERLDACRFYMGVDDQRRHVPLVPEDAGFMLDSRKSFPQTLLEDFRKAVDSRSGPEILAKLELIRQFCLSGEYSPEVMDRTLDAVATVLNSIPDPVSFDKAHVHPEDREALAHESGTIGLAVQGENLEDCLRAFSSWAEQKLTPALASPDTDNGQETTIKKVLHFISDNLASDLSLDRVAEHAGVSPSHLSRLFKSEIGMGYSAFVSDKRLEAARTSLESMEAPIQDIGKSVGFNTPAYFIRQFKAKYGKTPNEYRQSLK